MRRTSFLSLSAICATAIAGALAAMPVHAGGRAKERIYDDSFGNLVVLSPSGYKRIVVGMGHVAAELETERGVALAPYADRGFDMRGGERCYQPAVLWKGRGHMYGLADGEIPTPPVVCD